MMIPAGYLSDAYSGRSVLVFAGISAFLCFYCFIFFGGASLWVLFPCLFILGASLGVVNPVGVSFGISLEPNHPGTVSAFLMGMVWCVSEAVGPAGVGLVSSIFSDVYAPVKALAILGSFFLLQIYSSIALPKKEKAQVNKSIPLPN